MSLARRRSGTRARTLHSSERAGVGVYSFHCTACGKCCNSGPQLSLPELFHHETRFIGCLTLRRVMHVRAGDLLGQGASSARATPDDERAFLQLADSLLFPLPGQAGEPAFSLFLATQALYEPGVARCPALRAEQTCGIHDDRKPSACAVAPLEALLPDRFQHHVLAGRLRAAEYHGTDCITTGEAAEPARVITRRLTVVQPHAHDALAQRRRELAEDKRNWGNAVFASLQRELLRDHVALQRIPVGGFVSIPPAPLLLVLASVSERVRLRVLRFVSAQLALIATKRAIGAQGPPSLLAELDTLARTSERVAAALSQPRLHTALHAADVEAWLGLASV